MDILNIGLLIVSALLAYHFPMELFVFAYAILGPLHYLTEINWLNNKSYFTSQNKRVWLSIGTFASVFIVAPKLYFAFVTPESTTTLTEVFLFIDSWSTSMIFITLVLAIGFLFAKKTLHYLVLGGIALLGAILFNDADSYATIVGMLIPTIVHVYIFTLLFMLYGSLKSKSKFGYVSIVLALIIPILFIYIEIDPDSYLFNEAVKSSYSDNGLFHTPLLFGKFLGVLDGTTFYFYSEIELRLMMFISFIYMYHYLNWFSKTTTIAWHKNLTLKRSLVIALVWIGMVVTFYIDFALGFLLALFLSFLHVILEFPLNMVSIKSIFKR